MLLSVANAILSGAQTACATKSEPSRGQRCKFSLQGCHATNEVSQSARLFFGANASIMFELKVLPVAKCWYISAMLTETF